MLTFLMGLNITFQDHAVLSLFSGQTLNIKVAEVKGQTLLHSRLSQGESSCPEIHAIACVLDE